MLKVESINFILIMYLSASLPDGSGLNMTIFCYVGYEILMELTKKCAVFWGVTSQNPIKAAEVCEQRTGMPPYSKLNVLV
jgi:hypothetical protein